MTVDLDALIAQAKRAAAWVGEAESPLVERLTDALESTRAKAIQYRDELRQERERADENEKRWHASVRRASELVTDKSDLAAALSRAEETIEAVRVARANHPECDKVPDGISCGWKSAVQDIDAALAEHEKNGEGDE